MESVKALRFKVFLKIRNNLQFHVKITQVSDKNDVLKFQIGEYLAIGILNET